MRKRLLPILLVAAVLLAFSFSLAQMPPQQQMKPEEVKRALNLVSKTEPVPEKYKVGFESITPRDTLSMLNYLASDWMEGRDTASRGYAMAADYVVSLFKMWGVKPGGDLPRADVNIARAMAGQSSRQAMSMERSYFQEFTLKEITDSRASVKVEVTRAGFTKARTFESGVDFMSTLSSDEDLSGPVVFAGYGIKEPAAGWDELKGLNLKDKIVLVLSEAPGKDDPKSPFNKTKELKEKYFPQAQAMQMMFMRRGGRGFNKLEEIYKQSPAAVLVVQNTGKDTDIYNMLTAAQNRRPNDERPIINRPRSRMVIPGSRDTMAGMMGGSNVPTLTITREMANLILENSGKTIDELKQAIESTYKPASRELPGVRVSLNSTVKANLVRAMNVIGYIEGSDPKLKDEYFVLGAHFDHLGAWEDYIFNGSDDNASGSVGVIAIARAMALNPVKPKRSIVFCLWTGEEKGLLGSRYYVQNPTFPMEKTVGYLNYDMISRAFDEQTFARYANMFKVQGVEDLVKQIRPAYFVTVNATKDSGFYEIQQEMNKYVGLDLFIREPELGQGGGGSDHSSFAAVKKPYVYYMTAMHPDYHLTGDSPDKASGELLSRVIRLGYLSVFAFSDK
ncbi:MAG: M20/M25/M40 family metallo-hydrolase [Candidatus Aminicenantes bacterium]|uniref:Aminopeptidase Y n=1 Tax=Candidatus Saccharicenans subterraneus TaxID=2508984 RepID=A0A3E2BLQ1_9BACT|nr:M20/M25/M40 family metallo-hydrolase [Candidatus Aminicenantes bacterium]RFT15670.1 MAG: Aminopeptidase Y [Candidatus Saccharicenans subterraneum]